MVPGYLIASRLYDAIGSYRGRSCVAAELFAVQFLIHTETICISRPDAAFNGPTALSVCQAQASSRGLWMTRFDFSESTRPLTQTGAVRQAAGVGAA